MENKDLKYWIAFSKCDFDSTYSIAAYKHFGSIQEAWYASIADIANIPEIGYKRAENVASRKKDIDPNQTLDEILSRNLKVITYQDKDYPEALKHITNPPARLFIKGDLKNCNLNKTLGVVGSRKATPYILEILTKLIKDLPANDITIISGMAYGTDTCAHRASLDANLKTIAVLGSGLDNIYPATNKSLFEEIINGNGAAISEYYPTTAPMAWQFPHRNRIVSGLSQGVILAEGAQKSGALITARLATEQNKELLCIPGQVTNPNTYGPHKLIKEGAALITSAQDIMDAMDWQAELVLQCQKIDKIKLLDNEEKVYKTLSLEPKSIDNIIKETDLSTAELMVILTSLELQGIIKQLPQEKFIRTL